MLNARETDDVVAAHEFRRSLLPRADGHEGWMPWWYGWVIVEAYLAGLKAGREEKTRLNSSP